MTDGQSVELSAFCRGSRSANPSVNHTVALLHVVFFGIKLAL